ncbi:MAG: T9SS type A sorting domain-containing protein [Flavobacteriales bacterium]|nr:T9SS type A sorting domain-containing protein [Flavobacteriales bacterium]
MKSFSLFLFIVLKIGVYSQQNTFFVNHQMNQPYKLQTWRVESSETGEFLTQYYKSYTSTKVFRLAIYNKYGELLHDFDPVNPYVDVSVYSNSISGNNRLFVAGIGRDKYEMNNVVRNFSYGMDWTGKILWEQSDSLNMIEVQYLNDSTDIAIEWIHKEHQGLKFGRNLVEINHNGKVLRRLSLDSIFHLYGMDSLGIQVCLNFIQNKSGYWFQMGSPGDLAHGILWISPDKKHSKFFRIENLTGMDLTSNGLIVSNFIGDNNYSQYQIQYFDFNFNRKWVLNDTGTSLSEIYGQKLGINPNGYFGFVSRHTDSTWQSRELKFNIYHYDNKKATLKRICRYSIPRLELDYRVQFFTETGYLFTTTDLFASTGTPANFMKTDSLGLVYNTDIICDCKDFNTGIETTQKSELHIAVFPNPSSERVVVQLPHDQKAEITLRNTNGKVIEQQLTKVQRNELDVSALPRGIYLLEVKTEEQIGIRKVVLD